MPSVQEIARNELRWVIEQALDNRLIDIIDRGNRDKYTNARGKPKTVAAWSKALADADAPLNAAGWFNAGTALYETGVFVHGPGTLRDNWKTLLSEVRKQQADDLVRLFKIVYERKYPGAGKVWVFKSRDPIYQKLMSSISPHYLKYVTHKNVTQRGNFFKDLHEQIEHVWMGVRQKDEKHVLQYLSNTLNLFRRNFEHGTEGLGLLNESIEDAFKLLGFKTELVDGRRVVTDISPDGGHYLEHNVGEAAHPGTTRRAPNAQRGVTYFYAWWLFDSEEDYLNLAKAQTYPRNRGTLRVNYKEPGRKGHTMSDILGSPKYGGDVIGNFLGARDMVDRNQPFTDRVTPLPPLRKGQVIALGAARAKLFDLANKEVRVADIVSVAWRSRGALFQPGMSMGEYIGALVREGKMRFDPTNLEWHWSKWDGQLPMQLGKVTGRVVDATEVINRGGTLPAPNEGASQAIFNAAGIGLNHDVIIEILETNSNTVVQSNRYPTDAEGRFSIDEIPIGAQFRVTSPLQRPHGAGKHKDGWPRADPLMLNAAQPVIENIIVPKKQRAGGGDQPILVRPDVQPENSHDDSLHTPFGHVGGATIQIPFVNPASPFDGGFTVSKSGNVPQGTVLLFFAKHDGTNWVFHNSAGLSCDIIFSRRRRAGGAIGQKDNYAFASKTYSTSISPGIGTVHVWLKERGGPNALALPRGEFGAREKFRLYCAYATPAAASQVEADAVIDQIIADPTQLQNAANNPNGIYDINYFEFELEPP